MALRALGGRQGGAKRAKASPPPAPGAGAGRAPQGAARVHFGLGEVTEVEFVEVRWPDGASVELEGVATRQRLTVSHPSLVAR